MPGGTRRASVYNDGEERVRGRRARGGEGAEVELGVKLDVVTELLRVVHELEALEVKSEDVGW